MQSTEARLRQPQHPRPHAHFNTQNLLRRGLAGLTFLLLFCCGLGSIVGCQKSTASSTATTQSLSKQLRHTKSAKRRAALATLQQTPQQLSKVMAQVLPLLRDSDSQIRQMAASLLSKSPTKSPTLKQALAGRLWDQDAKVRDAARAALTQLGWRKKRPQRWHKSRLSQAQAQAQGLEPIIVQVSAGWCSPCNQLAREVQETPAFRPFHRMAVALKVDFDKAHGQEVTKRYRVLGLPTTLILDAQGKERTRIEGYPGRDAYLQALRQAMTGRSNFKALQQQYKKTPKDSAVAFRYGRALLLKGETEAAQKLLLSLLREKGSVGAKAARVWGRWLLRVEGRAKEGTAHFLRACELFRGTRHYGGFLYWAAKGYHKQGKTKKALDLFEQWRHSNNQKALVYQADFMVLHNYPVESTLMIIRQAQKQKEGDAWLYYLLAQTYHRGKRDNLARVALKRALTAKPNKAIFLNFQRQLTTPKAR